MQANVIDLFCGIGGLTHGLIKAGLNVVAGLDIDSACRYAYETNNRPAKFINSGVRPLPLGMGIQDAYLGHDICEFFENNHNDA